MEEAAAGANASKTPWYKAIWRAVDHRLLALSRKLQRIVRLLRIVNFLLWFGVFVVLASALLVLFRPDFLPYAFAASAVFLVVPLLLVTILVGLPLRLRSLVRLIDQGYPDNARELAIRAFARKMRDESIETEELLVETAVNESKKVLRRFRERAEAMHDAAQSAAPPSESSSTPKP